MVDGIAGTGLTASNGQLSVTGGGGGGSSTFVGLSDTPSSFSNQGSQYLAVNSNADAIEFVGASQSNQVLEMIGDRCDGDSITTLSGEH